MATFARTQAQDAIDTLRRAFDAFVDVGDTENAVAVAAHPHGFLAYSSGTADMAARALDMVPPDSIEARYRPEFAWLFCDYAEMLVGAHGHASLYNVHEKALALLDEWLAISSELGTILHLQWNSSIAASTRAQSKTKADDYQ